MMIRLKKFLQHTETDYLENQLNEGTFPIWVRTTVGLIVLRIRNLSVQIESETDVQKQNVLIGRQNKLISYINGLGIGVGTNDTQLLNRLKTFRR